MSSDAVSLEMDHLDFLTTEQLLHFFHCKKTEISCIEKPHTLLNQLRDYNLIPEEKYKKVIRSKTKHNQEMRMYEMLNWFEAKRPEYVNLFWKCVFEDHILQQYMVLRQLRSSILNGSFSFEKIPEGKTTPEDPKMSSEKVRKAKMQKGEGEKEGKTVAREEKGKEKEAAKKRPCSDTSSDEAQPGSSSQSTPIVKRKKSKPVYRSPIIKGGNEEIWRWPFYRTQLPVSCGTKKGTLDREKLARGEKCILAEKSWFYPKDFETFGGKKNWKNWKTSIHCGKATLHRLIQEGHLKCSNFKSRCARATRGHPVSNLSHTEKERRRLFPSNPPEDSTSSMNTLSNLDSEEEEGQEQVMQESMEEDGGAENNGTDLSPFKGTSLPVTCGSARGTLYTYRFASGTCGKSIRTEDKWLTPEEFAMEDPTLSDPYWMRNIHCQGTPLSFLIEKRILHPHSVLCKCALCSREVQYLKEQQNDDECFICLKQGELVCCDHCPRAFHYGCHLPTLDSSILGEKWMCTYCVLKQSLEWRYPTQIRLQDTHQKLISDFTLYCQYLLLCLYKADEQHVFISNPCHTVAGYSNFIKHPMWLEKVLENLEKKHYTTVGQFYSDILLIFENCAKFNRDNDFGKMGARLRRLFEEEFRRVFNINIVDEH